MSKNALFAQFCKKIFLECGRKWGKSDFVIYCLYRYALMHPNSACFYIAPFQKQARELIWANNRLQNFLLPKVDPKTGVTHTGLSRGEAFQVMEELKEKYGVRINNTEMRIIFGNGSFIKLDGADQYEAYRGVTPHIVVYDEFKDFHPKFHEGMDPNLGVFDAPLICVGTPPVGDEPNAEEYFLMADYAKEDPEEAHYSFTAYDNPWISNDWLDKKRRELVAKGKEDEFFREYLALRVKAGSSSIFPMLKVPDPRRDIEFTEHVRPHEELCELSMPWWKSWEWFLVFDPASVSTFGVLFGGIHKYNKKIVILEEVYEQDKGRMSTGQIWPAIYNKIKRYPMLVDDLRIIYDNAAAWFAAEMQAQFGIGTEPCRKDVGSRASGAGGLSKESRLNLIKDILLREGLFQVSERCPKLVWEMQSYRTDDKGKIPKENDHLIDCLRYLLSNAYYDQMPAPEPVTPDGRRAYTPEQDLRETVGHHDPIYQQYLEENYE